jgi:hypothetical protein
MEDVASSFKTVLMFAIPMATIVITMSESLLTILNVSYKTASLALIVLTLDTIVLLISQFYTTLLLGIERLDIEAKISLNELVRSNMFKVFTLPYVQAAIALPATYYVLTQLATSNPVQAVLYVIAINLCVHIATFVGLFAITRKSATLSVPTRSLGRYIFVSAVTAAVLYLLPSPTTILLTLAKAAAGVAIYGALLLSIDAEARELVALIVNEIKSILVGT